MPRPRSDIRDRIIEAARGRFAAAGVDATSLRRIAADAGTSIGMIYYYFPAKDDLFLAVVENVFAQLQTELDRELGGDRDFRQSVLAFYRRIGSASPIELQVIRLTVREALSSGRRLERVARRFSPGRPSSIFETVIGGVRSGELRKDLHPVVLMAAAIALATLTPIARHLLGDPLPVATPDGAELTRQLCAVLMEGAGARP